MSDIKEILDAYSEVYDENDDKEAWFNKCKELCDKLGYASDMKAYKENPDAYYSKYLEINDKFGYVEINEYKGLYLIEFMYKLVVF